MNLGRVVLAAILTVVLGCAPALPVAGAKPPPDFIALPPDAQYPNGIAVASDGTMYVGQITRPGIARRSPEGRWDWLYTGSPEIYAGTSLRLDEARGLLWGTSPDFLPRGAERPPRLFAIDVTTGRVAHSVVVRDGFANDIAVEPDGAVLVSESRHGRVQRYRPGSTTFDTVATDPRLVDPSGIGAAGIARAADGTLVVGNFGAGTLFVVDDSRVRQLELPRALENPDGVAFAADGSLVVLESAPESGDGRVLRVVDPLAPGGRMLQTLADGLVSPVNLSIGRDGSAYVSESRIRHRMVDALADQPEPTEFRIAVVPVPRVESAPT